MFIGSKPVEIFLFYSYVNSVYQADFYGKYSAFIPEYCPLKMSVKNRFLYEYCMRVVHKHVF